MLVNFFCCSNNAFYYGEPGKEAMVHEIFQVSSSLPDSLGWLLVSYASDFRHSALLTTN